MNLETIKTVVLTLLVLISILLTLALWNYKPDYERFHNAPQDVVDEVDIGGQEISKKDVIQPDQVIFHKNETHFGFANIREQQNLFNEMHEWVLYDFHRNHAVHNPNENNKIEIIFPTLIPMEIIRSIFTFDEEFTTEDPFPSWSFNRIFITFNESDLTLTITFKSIDGREQATAIVNNASIYNQLMSYMELDDRLVEYIAFNEEDEDEQTLYLQAASVEMSRRTLAVENIESSLLVDALFTNPTLVSHNIREASFSDGQRALSILQEGRSMEYYNPIESSVERMSPVELLDQSIANINDHKGWTEDYHLVNIDPLKRQVRYQMHYDGYPIYNSSQLSIIEQEWKDQELHFYRRLLFSLSDLLDIESVMLHGGTDVVYFLENNSNFDLERISDIQVGYKLTYLEDTSYSIVLEPAWYVNYDRNWMEIRFDELEKHDKGGG